MKTIKIIDIAKLIAEERYNELPKKIKINNKTYEFDKTDNEYKRFNSGCSFTPLYEFMKNKEIEYFLDLIQMEAEIIEEEKEIKFELEELKEVEEYIDYLTENQNTIRLAKRINTLIRNQKKLIDAVNKLNKENK